MSKKKLSLKKEKITSLTKSDMDSIKGGVAQLENDLAAGSAGSSNHDFTCCWCTGGGGGGGTVTYDPNLTTQPTYTTNSPFPTR
ncbi:class I lanthipeptide [Chryseobacterium oryctis]|uniref:Class I lanthipeptide n=1 Tax=Chryseobacterium oryctis TaxID=2952618 RepID=A0ABT3HQR3_9FLAO|nr:class I lanthipeptide [Chryseobacterium oryctis]MCW3162123.1 class I lanthipeptide [Chryseobacterium oryctis]